MGLKAEPAHVCRALPSRNLTDTGPWSLAGNQLVYMQQLIAGDPARASCASQLGTYISRGLADPMLARLAILNPGTSHRSLILPKGHRRTVLQVMGGILLAHGRLDLEDVKHF